MTVVGLVVPGIPTVPFLLATSFYLARSSPRLNDRLRRTSVFGPILDEWERLHGLSRSSKAKLMGLTAAIVVVTVAVTPVAPIVLVVVLILASLSVYGIARLPAAPSATTEDHPGRPADLALALPVTLESAGAPAITTRRAHLDKKTCDGLPYVRSDAREGRSGRPATMARRASPHRRDFFAPDRASTVRPARVIR